MRAERLVWIPPLLAAFLALAGWEWLVHGGAVAVALRVPGMDATGGVRQKARAEEGFAYGTLRMGEGTPSTRSGEWPGFRGPRRDNAVRDSPPLARTWPPAGPPVLWSIPLGEGHAGAAVHGGRVYILDYDMEARADALRCLSPDDGAEIWRYAYPVRAKRNHGISRTVPAVDGRLHAT